MMSLLFLLFLAVMILASSDKETLSFKTLGVAIMLQQEMSMEIGLFRKLNAMGMLAVSAVLAMAFYGQFTQNELPCPLCLLQRIATVAVLAGLTLNVVKGPKPDHYSLMIISAFFGGAVSLRQISLHLVPGTGTYGAPFLGMHYYTWAFIVFAVRTTRHHTGCSTDSRSPESCQRL